MRLHETLSRFAEIIGSYELAGDPNAGLPQVLYEFQTPLWKDDVRS